jgi:hypothetical protein
VAPPVAGWQIGRMPLHWTIDSQERFMSVVGTGVVSRADVDGFIDAVMANVALGYCKLFDAGQATSSITADEMIELGLRFRSIHIGAVVGPLALVMPVDRGDRLERMVGMIAAANRPMRVFTKLDKAQIWIGEQARRPAPDAIA